MKELMKEADIAAREMGDTKVRGAHVRRNIGVLCFETLLTRENVEKVPWIVERSRNINTLSSASGSDNPNAWICKKICAAVQRVFSPKPVATPWRSRRVHRNLLICIMIS